MRTNEPLVVQTPADAAAVIRAALPKEQREERAFVLPLDAHGKALAKPILVSVGHEDGTAAIDAGAIFREALKAGAEKNHCCPQSSVRRSYAQQGRPRHDGKAQ